MNLRAEVQFPWRALGRRGAPRKKRANSALFWRLLGNFSVGGRFFSKPIIKASAATLWPWEFQEGNAFKKETPMLNLVVTLLVIALIAAVLGFGGIAMAAVGIAKIVFFVALLLFVIALIAGTLRTTPL